MTWILIVIAVSTPLYQEFTSWDTCTRAAQAMSNYYDYELGWVLDGKPQTLVKCVQK